MHIQRATPFSPSRTLHCPRPENSNRPLDGFTPGPLSQGRPGYNLSAFAMGAATGAIGIGGTGALGLGSLKAFTSGHPLLGLGLAAGAVASGATLAPISLMGAAMSTDSGDTSGLHGYLAGAGAALVGSAIAIF